MKAVWIVQCSTAGELTWHARLSTLCLHQLSLRSIFPSIQALFSLFSLVYDFNAFDFKLISSCLYMFLSCDLSFILLLLYLNHVRGHLFCCLGSPTLASICSMSFCSLCFWLNCWQQLSWVCYTLFFLIYSYCFLFYYFVWILSSPILSFICHYFLVWSSAAITSVFCLNIDTIMIVS